jgi:hypothetical protein
MGKFIKNTEHWHLLSSTYVHTYLVGVTQALRRDVVSSFSSQASCNYLIKDYTHIHTCTRIYFWSMELM